MVKSCVPSHLTASGLVLDADGEHVLLTLHRKGNFWAQMGGHCEPDDADLAAAALREATEESGIEGLRILGDGPVNLDRHALSSAFGSCGWHLDVRYAVVAPLDAEPVVSEESHDVAWFPVGELPPGAVKDLDQLVSAAVARLRSTQSSAASSASATSSASRMPSSSESPNPAVAETPSR